MQRLDEQLVVSASDLNAYTACRHLLRLNLEYARGEREKPDERDPTAEIVARKGDEHEARYLESLKADGHGRRRDRAGGQGPGGPREGGRRDDRGDARRRRGDLPGDLLRRRAARPRRLPLPGRSPLRPRRLELRGRRHQARPPRQALLHPPALLLQRAARPRPGHRARADPRHPRHQRAAQLPARRVRRLLPPRPRAPARRPRRRRPGHLPRARSITARSATGATECDERRIARRPPLPGRPDDPRADRAPEARPGSRPSRRSARAGGPRGRRDPRSRRSSKLRAQAAIQLRGREEGKRLLELLEPEELRGFARLPEPSPGDVFFDLEGDPFFEDGLEYLWGSSRSTTGEPEFTGALGARPRRGAGGLRAVHRLRLRAARALPRSPRLPLRPLRDRPC